MRALAECPNAGQIATMRRELLTALFLITAFASSASAASSTWLGTSGGRVRLVTTGVPDAKGLLTGVLEIELQPGWKTYWRDPGESGVPPTLDVSASPNIASAELAFPAPERFDDGHSTWTGYKHSVALPVKLVMKGSTKIAANIFLGVCKTICVPIQGKLTLDPADDPDNAADAAVVYAAVAALPAPDAPDFGVVALEAGKSRLLVQANLPPRSGHADIFIASEHGYVFGTPERQEKDGKIRFALPILERPTNLPSEGALRYTLVTDAGSVEGALPFP